MRINKVQFVWWWCLPRIIFWKYPRTWEKPMFYGLYLGVVEIRFFNKVFTPYEEEL